MKTPAPKTEEMNASVVAASVSKFTGTSNPRELRAIHALMIRPMPREHLDKFVGCSNGPDLVRKSPTLTVMGILSSAASIISAPETAVKLDAGRDAGGAINGD